MIRYGLARQLSMQRICQIKRTGVSAIAMSPLFHENIFEYLCEENADYKIWINPHLTRYDGSIDYYHCNIVETEFDKWIDENV